MPVFTKNTLSEAVAQGETEIIVGGRLTRKLQAITRVKKLTPEQIDALLAWAEDPHGGVNIIHYSAVSHESFGLANIFTDQAVAAIAAEVGIEVPLAVSFVIMCGGCGTNTIRTLLKDYSHISVQPKPGGVSINILIQK